jgi:hypothetical protein
MMCRTDGNDESLASKKRKMLHDAQDSIAQFLKEINHQRLPQYPLEDRIVLKKTEIKFTATRQARGEPSIQLGQKVINCDKKRYSPRRGTGAKKESKAIQPNTVTRERSCKKKAVGQYTPGTPNKYQKGPTPVSLKKTKTWGVKSATLKNTQKILATAASSRPERNKGIRKSLNQDALVPASDVESNSYHYSRSASPFLPSDGSTDTENSGEEEEVTNNSGKEDEWPTCRWQEHEVRKEDTTYVGDHSATHTKNHGAPGWRDTNERQGETRTKYRGKKPNGEDDGQDRAKASQVEPNQSNKITVDQVGVPPIEDTKIQEPSGV